MNFLFYFLICVLSGITLGFLLIQYQRLRYQPNGTLSRDLFNIFLYVIMMAAFVVLPLFILVSLSTKVNFFGTGVYFGILSFVLILVVSGIFGHKRYEASGNTIEKPSQKQFGNEGKLVPFALILLVSFFVVSIPLAGFVSYLGIFLGIILLLMHYFLRCNRLLHK